jgi:hypothetical protein
MGLRLCALRRATEHHTQPVNDIQIRSLGYDRRRGRLEIEFTWTDDVRQFYPVAPALYRQLLAAKPMYLFLKRTLSCEAFASNTERLRTWRPVAAN